MIFASLATMSPVANFANNALSLGQSKVNKVNKLISNGTMSEMF